MVRNARSPIRCRNPACGGAGHLGSWAERRYMPPSHIVPTRHFWVEVMDLCGQLEVVMPVVCTYCKVDHVVYLDRCTGRLTIELFSTFMEGRGLWPTVEGGRNESHAHAHEKRA